MKPILQAGLFALVLLFPGMGELSAQSSKPLPKNEGPVPRWEFTQGIQKLVLKSQFAELEKTHEDLLRNGDRFGEGRLKIEFFYEGLDGSEFGEGSEAERQLWFAKIEAWKKAFPASPLPLIAEAASWVDYAWAARGSGWASTVTEEGWKKYRERLSRAESILLEVKKSAAAGPVPPGWYTVMQHVALGQGWDTDRYDRLFNEAITAYPRYHAFYFSKAYYLLPRWHGKDGDLEAFAEQVRAGGNAEFYARIIWSQYGFYPDRNVFKSPHVRWEFMREGFEEMMKNYPDSEWNLSNYCRFACEAGDKATARRLFVALKGFYWRQVWPSREAYDKYLAWANEGS